ncbi:MAG: ferritin-like domain-containing protein [Pseudomonadota bacterium]
MIDLEQMFSASEWPEHWRGNTPTAHSDGVPEPTSLKTGAVTALASSDLDEKIAVTRRVAFQWFKGTLGIGGSKTVAIPDRSGRPQKPDLVPPGQLKKRSLRSERGRVLLLHAIAHIELNAVDLAWDIVARFSHQTMPRSFYDGWVRVALEEAKHFSLLRERLQKLGADYGDHPAHDGLWEASQVTGHSLTARLAIVPLILEARGLDVTPALLRQMDEIGDTESKRIFEIIYRDEQGHVAVGAKWFRYLCLREGIEPASAFQTLVREHFRGPLKPPFNDLARARSGLTPGFYRALSSAGT